MTKTHYIYYFYKYSYHHHHHHHVVPLARISLTLSRQFSLSFIAFGWSSGLHPVSSHSWWKYVGVHRSTSLMSPSLLLQCPTCLVRKLDEPDILIVNTANLVYSQALKKRRMCSDDNKSNKCSDKLKQQFIPRGFCQNLLKLRYNANH